MISFPEAPPRNRRQTRHPVAMIVLARTMYGDGDSWTVTQIRDHLYRQFDGQSPHLNTIRRWVVPSYADEQRRWNSESNRRRKHPNTPKPVDVNATDGPGRWQRITRLREEGLSYAALSTVIRVDYGIETDHEWVRSIFRRNLTSHMIAVLAGECPPQKWARAVATAEPVSRDLDRGSHD